jgi:hypothetical protein
MEEGGIKLTACARLSVSSEALTPAFRSTLTRLIGWKRWSVSTKTPRWFVLRLSICLRKSSGHRSLQMNLMLSRGDWGRGRLALNLWVCMSVKSCLVKTSLRKILLSLLSWCRLFSSSVASFWKHIPLSSAPFCSKFPRTPKTERNSAPTSQQAPARPYTPSHPASKTPHPSSRRPTLPLLPAQSYPSSRRRPQSSHP